jgi:COP9 signalosome complex subunit 1
MLIGTTSTFLSLEALKLAILEAKNGRDIKRYLEAQLHLYQLAPEEQEASRDQTWLDNTDRQNQAETARLEAELKGYKNNLIKESIRVST